jgi:hypothetical protein
VRTSVKVIVGPRGGMARVGGCGARTAEVADPLADGSEVAPAMASAETAAALVSIKFGGTAAATDACAMGLGEGGGAVKRASIEILARSTASGRR